MSKSIPYSHWSKSVQTTARKKNQTFETRDDVENHPSSKGYSLCKILNLGHNFKFPKRCQNRFCIHIGIILCKWKNRSKKHQILHKWDDVENRPSCKGYSLCKIRNLGQKFKLPKTCQNRDCIHIGVILWKKSSQLTPNYPEMRRCWKSVIL